MAFSLLFTYKPREASPASVGKTCCSPAQDCFIVGTVNMSKQPLILHMIGSFRPQMRHPSLHQHHSVKKSMLAQALEKIGEKTLFDSLVKFATLLYK